MICKLENLCIFSLFEFRFAWMASTLLISISLTLHYATMVDVILLLRPDYVALLGGCGPRYVHLNVLWPDHLRQVLERVQHLIAKVELYELEVLEAHATLALLIPHLCHVALLLLDDLEASLSHLLLKVEVVEH